MLGNRLSQQTLIRAKAAKVAKKYQSKLSSAFVLFAFFARLNLVFLLLAALNLRAKEIPKFLGAQSCATSGCHGGADDKSRQFTIWSKYDVHHERPYATLTTARSERIAETLKLGNPTQAARCTVCHAPMQTVPAERFAGWGESPREPGQGGNDLSKVGSSVASPHQVKAREISQGVSCENCHGPAENWIRSHTRKDYTHTDRVHAGMRDLQNLYVRANTCVACHQNVDADILAAGHPELIFELDGQCVTQPKHWHETTNWNGAQAWLVGQYVASREMAWPLQREEFQTETNINMIRWDAIAWVLNLVPPFETRTPQAAPPSKSFATYRDLQDREAHKAGSVKWSPAWTQQLLRTCSEETLYSFKLNLSVSRHAHRAERLVLALDRLIAALPELDKNEPVQSALKQLFKDAQSLPDFQPAVFADHLAEFQKALPK